ncbi:MAG TPA: GWxTD domain-containing protein, partial [Bacteroidetes bacterium]|nr:GWxTD domain-containing protein [Bacteroidota bacterium]
MKQVFSCLSLIALLTAVNLCASPLNMDACRFKGEDDQTYLELYLEFPRYSITHTADSSGRHGALTFTADITSGNILLASDKWRINDIIDKPGEFDSLQKIVDIRVYKLPPDSYNIKVTVVDDLSGAKWEKALQVEIDGFQDDELTASDIELAGYLLPAGIMEKYDRGEFALVPSPNLVFGRYRPYFYYYMEIYPPGGGREEHKLTLQRAIVTEINGFQFTAATFPEVVFSGKSEPFADVDSVSLEGLPTGGYTLVMQIVSGEEDTTVCRKRFWIMRSDLERAIIQPVDSAASFDSSSVEKEFQDVQILLRKDEIRHVTDMTPADKARFLNLFWRRYDDDTSTPEVPFREEFRQRITEADRRWDNYRSAGHKTDRGRIYVLHGEPDNRETHTFEISAKPYEIWTYDHLD